jgi:hypothetical protein
VDDGKIRISEGLCWAICPRKLPTVEQVNACRFPEEGPEAMERSQTEWPVLVDKIDSDRPGYIPWGDRAESFNTSCLANTVDCPNCERLLGNIPVDPFKLGKTWALGMSYKPAASMYITFKATNSRFYPQGVILVTDALRRTLKCTYSNAHQLIPMPCVCVHTCMHRSSAMITFQANTSIGTGLGACSLPLPSSHQHRIR